MRLVFGKELKALEDEQKYLEEKNRNLHQWGRKLEEIANRYQLNNADLEKRIQAFQEDKSFFEEYASQKLQEIKTKFSRLQEKANLLRVEVEKLENLKAERQKLILDNERISKIATQRLHAYQSTRSLLCGYKAALKGITSTYSSDARKHIANTIEKHRAIAQQNYQTRNIQAKEIAKRFQAVARASANIHAIDIGD